MQIIECKTQSELTTVLYDLHWLHAGCLNVFITAASMDHIAALYEGCAPLHMSESRPGEPAKLFNGVLKAKRDGYLWMLQDVRDELFVQADRDLRKFLRGRDQLDKYPALRRTLEEVAQRGVAARRQVSRILHTSRAVEEVFDGWAALLAD